MRISAAKVRTTGLPQRGPLEPGVLGSGMREQAPPDANTRSPDAGSADFPVVRGVGTPRVRPALPPNQHQRSEHSHRGGPPCERNHVRENRVRTRRVHLVRKTFFFPKLCLLGSQQYRPPMMREGVSSRTVGSAGWTPDFGLYIYLSIYLYHSHLK